MLSKQMAILPYDNYMCKEVMPFSGLDPYQFELMRMNLTNLNRRKNWIFSQPSIGSWTLALKFDLDRSLSDNAWLISLN